MHPACPRWQYTYKKENKIFFIYKEIQMGLDAKSYMRKGFLIYEEMHKYFHHISGSRQSYMTLHPIPLNFLIYEENFTVPDAAFPHAWCVRGLTYNSVWCSRRIPWARFFKLFRPPGINPTEPIPYNMSPLSVVMEQVIPQQCPLNVQMVKNTISCYYPF